MMTMIEDWVDMNASLTPQYLPSQDSAGRDANSFPSYGDPYGGGGDLGSQGSVLGETQNVSQYLNSTPNGNDSSLFFSFGDDQSEPPIFDRSEVKAIFLVLYTIVFCSCFFGNLMVILVVTLHWRMRSITNFCLANLAFADLCVGIFCVYQNIVSYLMESWVFGEFMCKMYHFINSLSTTASVLILVVICIERYLAIIHPMTCKQILTLGRLRQVCFVNFDASWNLITFSFLKFQVAIVFVWILSAVISSPRFYYFSTISMPLPDGEEEILCLPNRTKYDSKLLDMISMVVLFLIPLGIISVLYTQIGVVLWKTSNTKMPAASASVESSSSSGCYYRETDNNLIQTVNLTLLPINGVQQSQLTPSASRPTTLHGILPSSSSPATLTTEPHPHRHDKKSFLSSPFTCISCGKRTKKQRKTPKRNQNQLQNRLPNAAGNDPISRNNIEMDGTIIPCLCQCHNATIPSTQDYHNNCIHNSHPTGGVVSGDCIGFETEEIQKNKQEPQERSDSPITTTCCGGRGSRCLNPLRKHEKKSVTFSTPPSPFCNRNCSCLDGKSSKTDPIVLVKFEKKQNSKQKGRRSQCTILMNTKNTIRASSCNCESEDNNGSVIANGSCIVEPPGCSTCRNVGDVDCAIEEVKEGHVSGSVSHARRNFCFEQTRDNMSVDSGISGMRPVVRRSMEGGCCDQNFDSYSVAPTPPLPNSEVAQSSCQCSCETLPTESAYRQPLKYNVGGNSTPPKTKRLRRLRIVKSSKYGTSALQSRRRIIRMLIVVVLAFALCHLPFHARKIWQYWSPPWAPYHPRSVFSQVFTPLTFLIMYVNSGINPILYAFMSKKFRMSFKDLLCCKMRHSLRISRNASVRSTHAVALSQTGC
ncbi:Neuropeptide FF receptor 1 [Orchesella cincta]|uniref:Neuropeptide FF receptor 1 n=1 Tax=Orchesella cincta TaxID=48709 RepID=A0A1D2MR78_ORCCI|nr:Neuropeptide FF receptor 1 [Orchesella cincta]